MTALLIAGATGLVGRHVLALALDDERVDRVVAPTRRPLTAHPKLNNPVVDFGDPRPDADWWRVDAAICALGTTRATAGSAEAFRHVDHDLVLSIAGKVHEHGATGFGLVSSMGANAKSLFLYTRTKGEVEDAVRRLGFASLTIVRPGLLGGERDEFRATERVSQIAFRLAAPLLPHRLRISPAVDVARVLVDGAVDPRSGEKLVGSGQLANLAESGPLDLRSP